MNIFFLDLLRYNNKANQLIIESLLQNTTAVTERCIGLMSHILNVHQIWNYKITNGKKANDPWKLHSIVELETINKGNLEATIKIINEIDLDVTIKYSIQSGKTFTNSVSEILFQIINHSTYHRGQIATEFRKIGIDPNMTDYILFRMKPAEQSEK